jgi:hypothetical protein
MELLLVDTVTEERESTVVLSIVKRVQLDQHSMPARGDDPRKMKKGVKRAHVA